MRMGDRMDTRLAGVTLLTEALRCQRVLSAPLPIAQFVPRPVDSLALTRLAHSLSLHAQRKCVSVPTLTQEEVYL